MSLKDVSLRHLLTDWMFDRQRRIQVILRIVEAWAGGAAGILTVLFLPWYVAFLTVPLAEFVLYEFIFEWLGFVGAYWERGPAEGKTFTIW